jgi:TPR repeat protein
MKKYLLAMMLALAGVTPVRADVTYGPWKDLGNHVSARVMGPLLLDGEQTWEFRNDGTQTITYMDFTYTDKTGTHEDQLPGSLKPGATIGGWAAFTFTPIGGGQTLYLSIKAIKHAGDDNTSGNATGANQSGNNNQQAAWQQQQAAAQERQQQAEQQNAANQAQLQGQQAAQGAKRQRAIDTYNAAMQRNQAMQNTIQNGANQLANVLQQQQEQNEAGREQREAEQQQLDAGVQEINELSDQSAHENEASMTLEERVKCNQCYVGTWQPYQPSVSSDFTPIASTGSFKFWTNAAGGLFGEGKIHFETKRKDGMAKYDKCIYDYQIDTIPIIHATYDWSGTYWHIVDIKGSFNHEWDYKYSLFSSSEQEIETPSSGVLLYLIKDDMLELHPEKSTFGFPFDRLKFKRVKPDGATLAVQPVATQNQDSITITPQVSTLDALRQKAEQGNAAAQNNLGWMYQNGQGVTRDYAQAADWYRKAATQGNAIAQSHLGWMYYSGKGVTQDYAQAAEWHRKAAEQGDANAQDILGMMYQNGQGVDKDLVQAKAWYQKAAAQGNEDAKKNLSQLNQNNQ